MDDDEITNFFKQFGTILDIDIPRNEYGNLNKGRAFIEYQTSFEAENALKHNNTLLKGRPVQLTLGLT